MSDTQETQWRAVLRGVPQRAHPDKIVPPQQVIGVGDAGKEACIAWAHTVLKPYTDKPGLGGPRVDLYSTKEIFEFSIRPAAEEKKS